MPRKTLHCSPLLTQSVLAPTLELAKQFIAADVLTESEVAALATVSVSIADLNSRVALGETTGNPLVIDAVFANGLDRSVIVGDRSAIQRLSEAHETDESISDGECARHFGDLPPVESADHRLPRIQHSRRHPRPNLGCFRGVLGVVRPEVGRAFGRRVDRCTDQKKLLAEAIAQDLWQTGEASLSVECI